MPSEAAVITASPTPAVPITPAGSTAGLGHAIRCVLVRPGPAMRLRVVTVVLTAGAPLGEAAAVTGCGEPVRLVLARRVPTLAAADGSRERAPASPPIPSSAEER